MTEDVRPIAQGIVDRATKYAFGSAEDMEAAYDIAQRLTGYKPTSKSCTACKRRALNILREFLGLPPVDMETDPVIFKERIATCKGGCPVYQPKTHSCGRLVVDAFNPKAVELPDGTEVIPCGCVVDTKARLKNQKCPAGYWKR